MSEQNVQVTQAAMEAAQKYLGNLPDMLEPAERELVEAFSRFEADIIARHRTRAEPDLVEVLKQALKLAANRLDCCALEALGTGKVNQYEWHEWADEARAALTRADV